MSTYQPSSVNSPLTRPRIMKLWAAVTLPILALAWIVAPLVIRVAALSAPLPAVLLYWLVLMPGMIWQMGLALWVVARQEGDVRWATLRRAIRLNKPLRPKTDTPSWRPFGRMVLSWPLVLIVLIVGVALPILMMFLRRFTPFGYTRIAILRWPAYANVTEFASPEFAEKAWLLPAGFLGWVLSALCAEELLFRGVLLPRMQTTFGKWDWCVNALLYAFFNLFQYWLIPIRLIVGLIIARQARRSASFWPSVVIRAAEGVALLALFWIGVTSRPLTSLPVSESLPYLSKRPSAVQCFPSPLSAIPAYDVKNPNPFQVDLRCADVSALDLQDEATSLAYASFDLQTIWPPTEQMPSDFDPAHVLDLGKNPGLGLRTLHAQGITGRGVGIAIIDQPLLTEHQEYVDRLCWYEEISGSIVKTAQMHGPAVTSLAVGKTVGVAPEADLYYIGGAGDSALSILTYSHDDAQAVRRIIQINAQLPPERKIRAISISGGWIPELAGYHDMLRAVREAEAAGIMVVNVGEATGLNGEFLGMGRPLLADPDLFGSYEPGIFWAERFYVQDADSQKRILVPMDARTVASYRGPDDYEFQAVGGGSWTPPYVAGLYALAVQANPAVTPEQFWEAVFQTGRTVQIEHEGQNYDLGAIVDPEALINTLHLRK